MPNSSVEVVLVADHWSAVLGVGAVQQQNPRGQVRIVLSLENCRDGMNAAAKTP